MKFSDGSRSVSFRYDLIRNGAKYSEALVSSGSINFDSNATISGTAQFTLIGTDNSGNKINWLTDRIKPVMKIQDVGEFLLGEYILSTPSMKNNTYNVEAYDKSLILKEDKLYESLYIPAGTRYKTAIEEILVSASIGDVIFEESDAVLAIDRVFEIGTSKIDIINQLLNEMSFEKIYVDLNGTFNLRRFKEASPEHIDFIYKDDEFSILNDDTTYIEDFFDVPNIFIATVSNPEQSTLTSVYINDNVNSILSTVNRGRNIVSEVYSLDTVSSQKELDDYIKKVAYEQSQISQTISFSTALMPVHGFKNTIGFSESRIDVQGLFTEESWSMDLTAGGAMIHNARKVGLI